MSPQIPSGMCFVFRFPSYTIVMNPKPVIVSTKGIKVSKMIFTLKQFAIQLNLFSAFLDTKKRYSKAMPQINKVPVILYSIHFGSYNFNSDPVEFIYTTFRQFPKMDSLKLLSKIVKPV